MKIKSIPENPTITLDMLKKFIVAYEYYEDKALKPSAPMEFVKNASAAAAFRSILMSFGVEFEDGDQA